MIDEADAEAFRAEFLSLMQERFLRGDDQAHFDYAECDHNPFLCAKEEELDGEAAYFNDTDTRATSLKAGAVAMEAEHDSPEGGLL